MEVPVVGLLVVSHLASDRPLWTVLGDVSRSERDKDE